MKPRPTERLLLRAMREGDAPALFAIYGDPEVMRYAADEPFPEEATVGVMLRSVARLLAAGESLEWAVVEKASGQLVGTCGLHSFDDQRLTAQLPAGERGRAPPALRAVRRPVTPAGRPTRRSLLLWGKLRWRCRGAHLGGRGRRRRLGRR